MSDISFVVPSKKLQVPVLLLCWVILSVAINPYGEFPFNDDWAYAKSVKALVETHTFFMSGWTSTNLLTQIGWGSLFCLPFGFSFTALRISTLVAGLLGLWGTYRLIRSATDNSSLAFLGGLLMIVNPMYLGLSASFMTDIPFYALMMWSLYFMVDGLKKDAFRLMIIGLGLAVLALLIRQLGVALFAGFGLAYIARKGINLKSISVAGVSVVIGLATQLGYQKWLTHMMPGIISYNVQATNFFHLSFYKPSLLLSFTHNTFVTLTYTGGFLFPYFLVLITKNSGADFRANRWLWLFLTGLVVSLWYYFFDGATMPFWFNVLNGFGIGPLLIRDMYYNLYSLPMAGLLHWLWIGVTTISLSGSIILLFYLVKLVPYLIHRPANTAHWAIAVLLVSVGSIYYFPVGMHVVFDRYLLPFPVLFLVLIYLIRGGSVAPAEKVPLRWPVSVAIGLMAVYGVYSLFATHDYLAANRVRWQVLRSLMDEGIQPTDIDGGLEFNGWYTYDSAYKTTPSKSWWWVQGDTYVASASLLPGYSLFRQKEVNTWFPWGIQRIIIGRKNGSAFPKATN